MDAAEVLQTVLSVIQGGTPIATPSSATSTPSSSQMLSPQGGGPPTIPQMIVTLLSLGAFWDWLKVLLVGAFLEICRRGSAAVWEKLWDSVWVTADFEWDSDGAEWLMYWLSQQRVFQKARSIEVCTWYFGPEGVCVNDLGDSDGDDRNDQVVFLPSLARTYSLWYRGLYLTVSRDRVLDAGSPWKTSKDMLQISMLTRDSGLLRELLKEARKAYKAANGHLIDVFVTEGTENWQRVAAQEKRPMSSVVLDPGVFELVLEDARDFLNSRKWYSDRGIPFRRGYLLYGAPGAGKTSMIHSIAGELGLAIYILSLTVTSLNDNSLKALISHLPKSCILLMEDIDAAFVRGIARRDIANPELHLLTSSNDDGDDNEDSSKGHAGRDPGGGGHNGVTLSGLLNALDGIAAQEGRILFATTNDYAALDPALLRPGRLDLHIEFGLASKHQAKELFKRFYTSSDAPVKVDEEDDDNIEDDGAGEKNSAYSSRTVSPVPPPGNATSKLLAMPEGVKSVYVGMTCTRHSFQLPQKKAAALVERFAAAIPPHTFSMATLQGYLMAYKVRPYVAVEEAPAWVEKKMRENDTQAAAKGRGSPGASTLGKTGTFHDVDD
ncbi:transporter [Ganoderma sinense ZZ0214-1]|uniref:Transporter n=1 Tax=Ganoderma sinense ZZ0214-1 TaxID=1077348 RepID=A0A2G8RTA7_9APHY|nr:transporter [Ganoderma sinense ZZ0214-1]